MRLSGTTLQVKKDSGNHLAVDFNIKKRRYSIRPNCKNLEIKEKRQFFAAINGSR